MVVQRVHHLNRVRAAGDIEHGAVAEVCTELLAVQRRRRDYQPQGLCTASSAVSTSAFVRDGPLCPDLALGVQHPDKLTLLQPDVSK